MIKAVFPTGVYEVTGDYPAGRFCYLSGRRYLKRNGNTAYFLTRSVAVKWLKYKALKFKKVLDKQVEILNYRRREEDERILKARLLVGEFINKLEG